MILAAVLLFGIGGAALVWHNRTGIAAWAIAAYLKGDDVTEVSLDVATLERNHMLIRDIRIAGKRRLTAETLDVAYTFTDVIAGRIDSLTLKQLRVENGPAPIAVDLIKGDGRFSLTPFALDRLTVGFDLIRLRAGVQRFDPSRIELDYHANTLVLETAFTAPDGYVTALGSGPLNTPGTPFHLLMSGRLNAALAAAPLGELADAQGYLDFSVSAETSNPLFFLAKPTNAAPTLPQELSVTGTVRLSLDRLTVLQTVLPTAAADQLRFRVDAKAGDGGKMGGSFDIALDLGKRDTPAFGFALAETRLTGRYAIDGSELSLSLSDGPLLKLRELRLSEALPVPGDIALRLRGGSNRLAIDLDEGEVSHSVDGQLSWGSDGLSLKTEGHLSDPEDSTVFTLRGAFDATPLLALSPYTKSASGKAHVFLAGRIARPLLLLRRGPVSGEHRPGDIRLDGAAKLETAGLAIPGSAADPAVTDLVEIVLKNFDGSEGQPGGRLAVNGTFGPRTFDGLTVDRTKLALDGRISYGTRGYQFLPGIESVLNVKSLKSDAGIVVPGGLNFQLTGRENHVTMPADLSTVYHELTLAHIEADGYVETDTKKKRPFRITLPKITSRRTETGNLSVYLTGGSVELPDDKLIGRGVNAAIEETPEGYSLRLETGDIRHEARPPMTTPLALTAKGVIRKNVLSATLDARQLYTPLKLRAAVTHDLARRSGRMDFTLPRIAFGPKAAALDDIFPPVSAWVDTARGATSAAGHLLWDKDILSGQMTVEIAGVDLANKDVRLSGISGTVNFIELLPLSMPPRQRLAGKIATNDLGPWPMQLEFQLREDGRIEVQDLDIEMVGGIVRTRALIDPAVRGAADGSVQLRAVDLREMLELIGVEGLNGTGRITGTVPVRVRDGKVSIADGRLKADGPGVLRYRGKALQEQLGKRTDTVGTVAQALSDFRYEKLSMEINKSPDGEGVILLHMEGKNPKVLEGHPFAFNIKIESDFHKLGRIAQGGLQTITEAIRRSGRPAPNPGQE